MRRAEATVARRERDLVWQWRLIAASMAVLTLLTALVAWSHAPNAFPVALLILVICGGVAFANPLVGVHLILLLSLIGDSSTAPWWPFTKNLSSRESILFLTDSFSLTPLELLLGVTWFAHLARAAADWTWRFRVGTLGRPILLLGLFVVTGLVYGLSNGGDRDVAIMEARPLAYLVVLYLLIVNVYTSRRHYAQAVALSMVAISIQSLLSLNYYLSLSPIERADLESLSEHTASVHMNSLFILGIGLVLFDGSRWKRKAMLVLSIPVIIAYFLSQRRGAMVALFGGIVVVFVVLFLRKRKKFWLYAPTSFAFMVLFLAATWNAQGALGLASTAVKSALFPDQLSTVDASSNLYRDLEAFNLWSTIRSSRVFGRGFGRTFDVVVAMPDISFFEFWQYLPHNSILWVWIKLGFLGFVTMLYVLGRAVYEGARAAVNVKSADDLAVVLAGVTYVVMFAVFAYVDIGFGIRPIVYLALCLAICADFVRTRPESSFVRSRLVSSPRRPRRSALVVAGSPSP